ncbi:MAG: methyltransferase [Rikenellaceae bacterium]|nr:methyltransferase [Rikenellaceae bacterium]
MGNNWFKFKQFTVYQESAAMRVGTDGVLLGAWAQHPAPLRILDIGSGTGVISLMAAQRWSEARIDAIDPDLGAFEQSRKNFELSPWSNRLTAHNCDLQHFTAEPYDLIISNPPYFVNSLKNPDLIKSTARHTDTLPHNELVLHAARLLSDNGTFAVILPADLQSNLFELALKNGLSVRRTAEIFDRQGRNQIRIMAEFKKSVSAEPIEEQIYIRDVESNDYTEQYKSLTRDFYLKF